MRPKRPAPKGLDYVPVEDGPERLTFGVVRPQVGTGPLQTTGQSILRRLSPGTPASASEPWRPTCYRWDVLLPQHATDNCINPKVPCDLYEEQAFKGLKDLIVMATLRPPAP